MRTVWKFAIQFGADRAVGVSADANVIHAALDPVSGLPTLWIEHHSDEPPVQRTYFVIGTGHPIPLGAQHVGSMIDHHFVWHIYERKA